MQNQEKNIIRDSDYVYLLKIEDESKERGKLTKDDQNTFKKIKEEGFFNIQERSLALS